MWLLPVKGQGEWSRFVFLPWKAGEPPVSPLAKLYVSVHEALARVSGLSHPPCWRRHLQPVRQWVGRGPSWGLSDFEGEAGDEVGLLERETFPRSLEWVFWDRLWRTEEKEWKAVHENWCGTTPRGHCCFLFPYISPLSWEQNDWKGHMSGALSLLFFLSFFFFNNWSIVVLQCCVSFYCITKWISYT